MTLADVAVRGVAAIQALDGRLTITVPETGQLLGIGRDAAYAAAERGEIPTLRIGRRLLVPIPKLLHLLGASIDEELAFLPDNNSESAPARTLSFAESTTTMEEVRHEQGTPGPSGRKVHTA